MTRFERREFLINRLLLEDSRYQNIKIPSDEGGQKWLLRALMNIRKPGKIDKDFLCVQDEYLREELQLKGIVFIEDIKYSGGYRNI